MAIVFFEIIPVSLKERKRLKQFIIELLKNEGRQLESLNIIFCNDEYLLSINKEHLQHDFYTDIITFDLSETKDGPINAELYISIERVRENAINLKIASILELHRVIFHGLLHLCGYGDKKKGDILIMRIKEDQYLKMYFR